MASLIGSFWQKLDGPVHPEDRLVLASHYHTFDLRFPPPAFIGDIENAPVVILDANGGLAADLERTEFTKPKDDADHIEWIAVRGGRWPPPARRSGYYKKLSFHPWIVSGQAVLVNAVAYRSRRISEEECNRKVGKRLPSRQVAIQWLWDELVPDVRAGKRKAFANRWTLWGLKSRVHSDFGFSRCPISADLLPDEMKGLKDWLASL